MIFDKQGLFSNDQTVAIDGLSEQTVDLYKGDIRSTVKVGDTARDMGRGTPIPIRAQLTATAAGAVTVTIQTADAIDGSNDLDTPTTVGTMLIDGLTAGSWNQQEFLPHGTWKRYVQLKYSAACTVTAGIVTGHDQASHT